MCVCRWLCHFVSLIKVSICRESIAKKKCYLTLCYTYMSHCSTDNGRKELVRRDKGLFDFTLAQ